jgi:hypothetical protein
MSKRCLSNHISQQMLKISSTPINTHKDISNHSLSRPFIDFSQVAKGLTSIKDDWWSVSSLSNVAEHAEVLKWPTDEDCKEWGRGNLGKCTSKTSCLQTNAGTYFFSFICVGNSLLNFVQSFYIHAVYKHSGLYYTRNYIFETCLWALLEI